ncbi:Uncharacterised protein [uncultured archaeon]|nr:Uncharacterised protein [uncultured archaeon]
MRWTWKFPHIASHLPVSKWPVAWSNSKAFGSRVSLALTSSWPAQHFKSFADLFQSRHYAGPDDLFFSIDELPAMGKEYWFLHFCAPPGQEQVVVTAGRSVDPVKVNATEVEAMGTAKGSVTCAAVCWYHSQKRQVAIDSLAQVSVSKKGRGRSLAIRRGANNVVMSGHYPHFSISMQKGGREVFRAHAHPPRHGMPYEKVHLLKNPLAPRLGAAMVNYYFDFEGKLEGKPLKGKAYLQKVVAVMPLAPWNWVRVHFTSGAVLDFFAGKPFGDQKPSMHFASNDFFEVAGRRLRLGEVKLESWLEGDRRRWVLSGPNLLLAMESYSLQTFSMKQKTKFEYDEYLVRVTDFVYKHGPVSHTLADLGPGVGLVEDARGYLI